MKQIFIIITCCCLVITSSAQKTRFGINAGTAVSNFEFDVDGGTLSGDSRAGFCAGLFADIQSGKRFYIQPGLNWVQKGSDFTEEGSSESVKLMTNWLEVPVNFLYRANKGFFIGGGPSMAFGIGGKWKYEMGGQEESEKVEFGNSDDDDLRGFDVGLNFLIGYRFKNGIELSSNSNAGLSNLIPGGSEDGRLSSNYVGFKLGYVFKKKVKE